MIRYGSVSLPCTEEEKNKNAFQLHSPYELVHLQWLLGIPYNTVKLTMQFFFLPQKPQKD